MTLTIDLARNVSRLDPAKAETTARRKYRQNADDSYAVIVMVQQMIAETDALLELEKQLPLLLEQLRQGPADEALEAIKQYQIEVERKTETHRIASKLSRTKRALRGDDPDIEKAITHMNEAGDVFAEELAWRQRAGNLASELQNYDQAIASTIGMRMQARLTAEQAEYIADCRSVHRDLSLHF